MKFRVVLTLMVTDWNTLTYPEGLDRGRTISALLLQLPGETVSVFLLNLVNIKGIVPNNRKLCQLPDDKPTNEPAT